MEISDIKIVKDLTIENEIHRHEIDRLSKEISSALLKVVRERYIGCSFIYKNGDIMHIENIDFVSYNAYGDSERSYYMIITGDMLVIDEYDGETPLRIRCRMEHWNNACEIDLQGKISNSQIYKIEESQDFWDNLIKNYKHGCSSDGSPIDHSSKVIFKKDGKLVFGVVFGYNADKNMYAITLKDNTIAYVEGCNLTIV